MNPLRRKLAIASWDGPREPNIFGRMTFDIEPALSYVSYLRRLSGEKVTLTTVVGKAVAMALRATPSLNGHIRLGSYVPHERVNVAFLVAFDERRDLAKVKIDDLDQKSVVEATVELRLLAERLRSGGDKDFNKSMGVVRRMPTWALKPLVRLTGFVTTNLGVSLPALGLEAFPFGSCVITNVGVFGLDEGFVPPTPFAGVPLYVLIGAVKEAPMAVDGKVVVRKQLTLTATIDHRYMDGAQGASLAETMRRILSNPFQLEGLAGPPDDGK